MKRSDMPAPDRPDAVQQLLRRILAGEQPAWPAESLAGQEDLFLQLSAFHGLRVLVYQQLRPTKAWQGWPAGVRQALQETAENCQVLTLRREYEAARVLAALTDAGIPALLLKGAAISHTHYPQPFWRERGDTDIWIPPSQREAACTVLQHLGWVPVHEPRDPVSYQMDFLFRDGLDIVHSIDLHWRISNMQLFAWTLDFDRLYRDGIEIKGKHGSARGLAPGHALLHACIHRLSRPQAPLRQLPQPSAVCERLIGLQDIRLLATAMDTAEWRRLADCCRRHQLCGVVLAGLAAANALATVEPPRESAEELHQGARQAEPARAYIRGGVQRYLADWRHLPSAMLRLRWLYLQALPASQHLRLKYDDAAAPAWRLYLRWWGDAMRRLPGRRPG